MPPPDSPPLTPKAMLDLDQGRGGGVGASGDGTPKASPSERGRMTRLRHYSVYGGPEGRSLASVDHGMTIFRAERDDRGRALPYEYVLVDGTYGTQAFVPRQNSDLLTALAECGAAARDRERDTLAAEVQRRGLDF